LLVLAAGRMMRFQQMHHLIRRTTMCIERIARNAGFAIAAIAIVTALGFTIEFQPVINALAR